MVIIFQYDHRHSITIPCTDTRRHGSTRASPTTPSCRSSQLQLQTRLAPTPKRAIPTRPASAAVRTRQAALKASSRHRSMTSTRAAISALYQRACSCGALIPHAVQSRTTATRRSASPRRRSRTRTSSSTLTPRTWDPNRAPT